MNSSSAHCAVLRRRKQVRRAGQHRAAGSAPAAAAASKVDACAAVGKASARRRSERHGRHRPRRWAGPRTRYDVRRRHIPAPRSIGAWRARPAARRSLPQLSFVCVFVCAAARARRGANNSCLCPASGADASWQTPSPRRPEVCYLATSSGRPGRRAVPNIGIKSERLAGLDVQ